jgi:hypothetical protein
VTTLLSVTVTVPGKLGVIVKLKLSPCKTVCGRLGLIERPEAAVPEIL